jgi:hypothetical protein
VLEKARPVGDDDVPDADVVLATFWRTAPWVAALSPRKGAKAILLQGYEILPGRKDAMMDAAWRLPFAKDSRFQMVGGIGASSIRRPKCIRDP